MLDLSLVDYLNLAAQIIAVCSIIVKITPTQKDDNILAKVVKVLEVISLNKKV